MSRQNREAAWRSNRIAAKCAAADPLTAALLDTLPKCSTCGVPIQEHGPMALASNGMLACSKRCARSIDRETRRAVRS